MNTSPKKLSRVRLYKEVWKTPMHRLAAKYGLSDVGLAKVCKKMDVPRPPRGYWRRAETGKKVKRTPLPPPKESTVLQVEIREKGDQPAKKPAVQNRLQPTRVPVVEDELSDPHPLVASSLERFENAKEDDCGLVVPRAKRILSVSVSRHHVARCLRLMDTLIKSWEAEGLTVELARDEEENGFTTFLCSDNERLALSLQEKTEEYDPGPTEEEVLRPKWEWESRTACRGTGQVSFHLKGDLVSYHKRYTRRYADMLNTPIEGRAMRIWSAAMDYFEKRKQFHIREEEGRRRWEQEAREREERMRGAEEERERQREVERRRREEQRRVQELEDAARNWARANEIRKFIAACQSKMRDESLGWEQIQEWTAWAVRAADRIDPLAQGFPDLPAPNASNDEC